MAIFNKILNPGMYKNIFNFSVIPSCFFYISKVRIFSLAIESLNQNECKLSFYGRCKLFFLKFPGIKKSL